ncbi:MULTISPECIES: response regulator transcription factor [Exiguobacterium]|uniref:Response regulator transcription factor n=1 Tax=Exiguobacterium antarcticum TaxID=132920 RepID=A0ABT6R755_9BACL|nr:MULTISPECIES: response regulator transcription factor [Exiguobacterium]MCT4781590.1 response regulator transcription factor [Exiguobacterium soli]MDI3236126.1 response regulator transcription factor [Exiguobacterium antarcticum]
MKTIALVDDEKRMLELIELYLQPTYNCIKLNSGKDVLDLIETDEPELIILDVMMPVMDGFETCRKIREVSNVPIILLTALHGKEKIVKGLRLGADDYIVKPFDEEELQARIQSIFRRTSAEIDNKIECSGLVWDELSHELSYIGRQVKVTPKEFSLLGKLLKNPGRVYSREELLASLWSASEWTDERTVDSHVRNLREKLRKIGFPIEKHLQTVWGIGYKWTSY